MKRILFVDDDVRVLQGLKRMLFSHRKQWEMIFVEGGEPALLELKQQPFDVVVSDMIMPGMSGDQLLTKVQEQYPGVVRIILSGFADLNMALRTVHVAHHFLSKPCAPERLVEVVERSCQLNSLLNNPDLRGKICGLESLPVAPKIYNALTEALQQPNVSSDDLAGIVEQDTGICAKLLQLVNSSFLALPRRIASVKQAISYLGVNMLRNLVLTVEVFHQFQSSRQAPSFNIDSEQEHATLTTRIAKAILPDPKLLETLTSAAMLHDTGRLALASSMPELYERVSAMAATDTRARSDVEREVMGLSHAELGGCLLGIWGLPRTVVEIVAFHDCPSRVAHSEFDLLGVVHVADALAWQQTAPGLTHDLDLDYVRSVKVEDRIPEWKQVAAEQAQELGIASADCETDPVSATS